MSSDIEPVGIFIAGVQKAGTSALHSYFAEHPDLLAPRKKETHFFDNETTVDWARPDYEHDLHDRFYPRPRPGARAYDATPITIFWPPSIERIVRYNPWAKFIFLFRDPIERAFSNWRMEVGRAAERLDFSEAIREGRRRLDGLPELHSDRRLYSYIERGLYAEQLDTVLERVPRERLLFLSSFDLASRPKQVLADISTFLGIAPFPNFRPRKVFVGNADAANAPSDGDVDYLRAIFASDTERFSALSGIDTSTWLTLKSKVR